MIDFRYHLVSLISVFLALAVGIALGAGPLKETLGDTLTGQVEQLRTEKDELRAELDAARADVERQDTALDAFAPDLLEDVLPERRIALVELGDVDDAVHDDLVVRLEQAGAQLTGTVRVTEAWTDPAQRSFRQSLAGTLLDYLDPVPAEDAGTDAELAEALVQGLTTSAAGDPDTLSEPAGVVLQLLGEGGLVEGAADVTVPADAVVVLAGPTASAAEVEEAEAEASAQPEDAEELAARQEALVAVGTEIAVAAQARSAGAVVAGGELGDGTLVAVLRADDTTRDTISTVESAHTLTGRVSVPLALAVRIQGEVGHYGPGQDPVVPPRVELPPVERVVVPPTPAEPTEPTPEAGAPADGAEG